MRRLAILAFALVLGGCAQLGEWGAVTINNPVSRNELVAIESAYGAAASIAVGYRDTCARRLIAPSCRPIVRKLQDYDAKAHAAIVAARSFVRDNPTLNALSLLTAARNAIADYKAVMADNGVQ